MRTQEQKQRHAAYMRQWKLDNPEKHKAIISRLLTRDPEYYRRNAKEWRKNNPVGVAKQKRRNRIRSYGITPEMYEAMVKNQEGRCAICSAKPPRDLDVDHCHATGKVRGLLCSYCNKALGMFKDDPEKLKAAILYLEGVR